MSETTPTEPQAPEAETSEEVRGETREARRVPFDAPANVKGSDRKALYDRTEGRFVTGPGEPGKGAPAFDKIKGHTYATVTV